MIKMPLNRAVELLQKRVLELDSRETDIEAWKNRVLIDIEAIFGRGSTQHLSIIGTNILYFGDPAKLLKIKTTFRQTLEGYISFIKDTHIIDKEKIELSEEEYKKQYLELLEKWNSLVPDYNKLLEDYEELHKSNDEALAEIKILTEKLNDGSTLDTEKLSILFLGASPVDEVRLRLDEEVREIETRLKLASLRDSFELSQKWAVKTDTLQQAMLDEKPQIVHFSGHGSTSGIAIEDQLGNARIIDNDALSGLFELFGDNIKCVILNSCYSETQAKEIAKHVPYVIGMKSSVGDKAAIAFSCGFYAALGAGKDIPFAFKMGVVSVKLEGVSGSDIPVLLG
jgi:hypothetical protein